MNTEFHLTYLSGGDAYFGPNYGGATVNTVTRTGFSSGISVMRSFVMEPVPLGARVSRSGRDSG